MGYVEGESREQCVLFPESLDEYVEESNPVRAIDAFIRYVRFDELKFERAEPAETGRPGYDPRALLGILIWGHSNGVRSSRRLERECSRNVELMWLTGKLRPDFKTICRFRQMNGEAIKEVLGQFRVWAGGAGLFGKELVAIDGSKFKAVNSKNRSFSLGKLKKMIELEKKSVERYLEELEEADREDEGEEKELTTAELKEKIATIEQYLKQREELLEEMKQSGEKQRSLTDPDARLMKTSKGTEVCYNVQAAVDSKHKLIVAVEVSNDGEDQGQLGQMAQEAKNGLGVDQLTVVADGGYFCAEELHKCEENGITTYVPVRRVVDRKRHGLFTQKEFFYDESKDVYVCPQGAELRAFWQGRKRGRSGKQIKTYATKECAGCPLRSQCTKSKRGRTIERWLHQPTLARLEARIRAHPEIMKRRKGLVEHPFGTIKVAMNHERLLLKGLKKVATEISLSVISYNLKRVMKIMGMAAMIQSLSSQTA